MTDLRLPTQAEKTAYLLRQRQGLSDAEIARVLGCSRETANRRRSRFDKKLAAIRVACASGTCSLLETLLGDGVSTAA